MSSTHSGIATARPRPLAGDLAIHCCFAQRLFFCHGIKSTKRGKARLMCIQAQHASVESTHAKLASACISLLPAERPISAGQERLVVHGGVACRRQARKVVVGLLAKERMDCP